MSTVKFVAPLAAATLPEATGASTVVLSSVLGRAGRDGPVRAVLEIPELPMASTPDGILVATGPGIPLPGWYRERVVVAGQVTPGMTKLHYWITRRSDLDVEAFDTHWSTVHGPVASGIPGLVRYVQSLRVGPDGAHDGIAELWWEDVQSQQAAMATAEVAASLEDEKVFIRHDRVFALISSWGTAPD